MKPRPPYYLLLDVAVSFVAVVIIATGVVATLDILSQLAQASLARYQTHFEHLKRKLVVRFAVK